MDTSSSFVAIALPLMANAFYMAAEFALAKARGFSIENAANAGSSAAPCGVLIPLGLKRVGLYPALSGALILTTVTDIIGFLSFLGLASLILL